MPRLLRVLTTLPQYALMRFAFYAARARYCFPLPRSFNRQAPRRRISAMCISVFLPIPKLLFAPCRLAVRVFQPAAPFYSFRHAARGFFGLFARRAVLHFPLGSPCFPPRRLAHSRAKVFVPAFRACRVRRAVLTFPLLRSAFYVSFAEDVYCCKKCGKKGRRKNTAPNGLPVIDIVMFHHCPFCRGRYAAYFFIR